MSQSGQAVAQIALPVPLPQCFDYLPVPGHALPPVGSRVLVPFGRRRLVGLALGHGESQTPANKLKAIEVVLDDGLIGPDLLALHAWASRYYAYPTGEATQLLLPPALRRAKAFRAAGPNGFALTPAGHAAAAEETSKRAPAQAKAMEALSQGARTKTQLTEQGIKAATLKTLVDKGWITPMALIETMTPVPGPTLNAEQSAALDAIVSKPDGYQAFLLAGVTGSGKTEVYLQAARHALDRGLQVLMMIPEIGLTSQLIRRVESRLGVRCHVYHSDLSEGERLSCWQDAMAGRAQVVIGTRSSVFLPFQSLGLMVVDEEHDASFKQMDGARYQGRDLAVVRAKSLNIPIVLGSATPSLESLNNAKQGRYQTVVLNERPGDAIQPTWRILDQRGQHDGLSPELVEMIGRHLKQGAQVLLYRNRRGFAPVLMCQACGWQADCHRCSAHMTLHQSQQRLQCHHCGHQSPTPRRCPSCGDPQLVPLGTGTERLETVLSGLFPDWPVHRVDRDAMSGRHDFERLLAEVKDGGPCILVGTQMLAKGHHLPKVTLAAVLDVDQALFSGDFRAPERLGQVVYQVAGRAGRIASTSGQVSEFVLQTRHPEHALLTQLCQGDYRAFAARLLDERQAAGLPPSEALVLLRAEAHQPEAVIAFLRSAMAPLAQAGLQVQGPIASIMPKRGGYWRYQLWIQAPSRRTLIDGISSTWPRLYDLTTAKKVRWHVDVDPVEL